MKYILVILLQAVALAALAAGPPLENICAPFEGKDCEVIWVAPTNLPASVKIFAVVPTKYSPNTISNLLQIAELTPKNKIPPTQNGVMGGKDVLIYENKEQTRHLDVIPSQGAIAINKDGTRAQIPKELPIGVPDPKIALRLTLEILEKIGINRSELATNSDGTLQAGYTQGEVLHKDKSTGLIVTNIDERQIFLKRQIEGIPVTGTTGGVTAHFGNEGKLGYLDVTWRAVKPDKDCLVPDAAGFVSLIKSGRTLIPNVEPMKTEKTFKRLTITNVSLFYWENSGSEQQANIYPFAVLEAKTDEPGENAKVQLFVPLTD